MNNVTNIMSVRLKREILECRTRLYSANNFVDKINLSYRIVALQNKLDKLED